MTPAKYNREGIPGLLKAVNAKRGVEVGVYEGRFSKMLLDRLDLDKLHSIDPWLDANGDFDDEVYQVAVASLKPYSDTCDIIIDSSPRAAGKFEDASLDFVYIDGEHSYEATLADMRAWVSKIKPGGVLCGHDYSNVGNSICKKFVKEEGQQIQREVKKAVHTFIEEEPDKVYTLNLVMESCKSWWFFV